MRTRILIGIVVLFAVAGVTTGVLGLVKANTDSSDLRKARADIRTLQARVTDLAGAASKRDATAPSLSSLESSIGTLQSDVTAIVRACPDKDVNAYYQRLLGAQTAGEDQSAAINLLTTICPNVNL